MRSNLLAFVAALVMTLTGLAEARRLPVPKVARDQIIASAKQAGHWSNDPRLRIIDHKLVNRSYNQITAAVTGPYPRFPGHKARANKVIGVFSAHFLGQVKLQGAWLMAPHPR